MCWEYFIGKGLNGFKNIFIREIKENTPITDDLADCSKYAFMQIANYKKIQRINELKAFNETILNSYNSMPFCFFGDSVQWTINKNNAEIVQLERKIAEDRYNQINGIKLNTYISDDAIKHFIKTGESKMDNKEELKRSLAEEEQRAKDSLANVEKMKKQLEELNKKEVEVSATGCFLKQLDYGKNYFYINHINVVSDYMFTQSSDKERFNINNCFSTREQAEQEALRREGQEFIRRCAMLWNKGNDWRKKDTLYQCHLYFKPSSNSLCYMYDNNIAKGIPYFDNIALAEKCIAELKKKYNDEQIKTIFGVK